ncbi:flavodoxin family protein [Nesterenkonia natronophila]|uniref:Flavodoxin family protein n=1 Tax=Nesterenkonia natronophila TaxID=2174932 RepID=A0A3A4F5V5_9MICC|nr:flavodoxin domain-containing protein [Nesterenkonia natronophila]RJN33141.1 flavodoxin family protein [Nesterenkonia natronophila]
MDAVIVYESAWGNTKAIAEAVAEGIAATIDVGMVLDVNSAPPADSVAADLLVVGAPTHAFGLSRPQTREEASRRGGHPGDIGLREWINTAEGLRLPVAVFDTHVRRPNLPGAASNKAAKLLRRRGASLVAKPESFYVDGYEGPVLPGEIDRATKWGVELARLLPQSSRGA